MTTQNGTDAISCVSTAQGLSPAQQRGILLAEIAEWRIARYQLEVRHRVARKIGDPKERLDGLARDLERCEKALDALGEELGAFDTPQTS